MTAKKKSPGSTTPPGDDQTTSTAPILPPNGRRITSVAKQKALADILAQIPGNTCQAQRDRILTALRTVGVLTTFEAMRFLDCYDPRPRIMELRNSGIPIETHRMRADTEAGARHLIGLYVLAEPIPTRFGELCQKTRETRAFAQHDHPHTLQIQ